MLNLYVGLFSVLTGFRHATRIIKYEHNILNSILFWHLMTNYFVHNNFVNKSSPFHSNLTRLERWKI